MVHDRLSVFLDDTDHNEMCSHIHAVRKGTFQRSVELFKSNSKFENPFLCNFRIFLTGADKYDWYNYQWSEQRFDEFHIGLNFVID